MATGRGNYKRRGRQAEPHGEQIPTMTNLGVDAAVAADLHSRQQDLHNSPRPDDRMQVYTGVFACKAFPAVGVHSLVGDYCTDWLHYCLCFQNRCCFVLLMMMVVVVEDRQLTRRQLHGLVSRSLSYPTQVV